MKRVSAQELERLCAEAADEGCRAYIEGGDPVIDVLVIEGRSTAYCNRRAS